MSNVSQSIRAFRPSHCAPADEVEEETVQLEKLANLALYAIRARAGLPLFDVESAAESAASSPKRRLPR
jgi:hypothetical protein